MKNFSKVLSLAILAALVAGQAPTVFAQETRDTEARKEEKDRAQRKREAMDALLKRQNEKSLTDEEASDNERHRKGTDVYNSRQNAKMAKELKDLQSKNVVVSSESKSASVSLRKALGDARDVDFNTAAELLARKSARDANMLADAIITMKGSGKGSAAEVSEYANAVAKLLVVDTTVFTRDQIVQHYQDYAGSNALKNFNQIIRETVKVVREGKLSGVLALKEGAFRVIRMKRPELSEKDALDLAKRLLDEKCLG